MASMDTALAGLKFKTNLGLSLRNRTRRPNSRASWASSEDSKSPRIKKQRSQNRSWPSRARKSRRQRIAVQIYLAHRFRHSVTKLRRATAQTQDPRLRALFRSNASPQEITFISRGYSAINPHMRSCLHPLATTLRFLHWGRTYKHTKN